MNCNIMPKEMNIWTICDLFYNNFNLRLGETCVGASRASLIRLLQISHKINIMVFAAYLLERQFWCCLGWGIRSLFLSPTVGYLQLFQNKMITWDQAQFDKVS